ncbi:TetR/AcrR family transcriptional regulator [Nitratireductor sp. XY-223]|uniref:TetR/AcrR family transcriptional regulator n=1 Tax=Nitratireductor sp. XY-223 TaxID=2561926 RepID=UPI0010AB2F98|nr:TetR/AcrR family transcriptional regulator [Nitratireductor sp. XY-223]
MGEEKSNERIRDAERTIALLKRATVGQLITNGYAGLSILPILKKAGVSRGALFHHFPTKDHLIAAAFGDLLVEFAGQLHEIASRLRKGEITLEEFVSETGDTIASDLFVGCMEIALGIRAELTLSSLVQEAVADWRQSLFEFWDNTFELPGYDQEQRSDHWAMASNVLRGYAFSTSFGAAPQARERLMRGFPKLFLEAAVIRPANERVVSINTKSKS